MSNHKQEDVDGEEEPPSSRRRMNEDLNIETENTINSQQVNPINQTTGLVNEEANTNPTTSARISNHMTGIRTMNESTSQQQQANNNNISEQNVEPVEGGSENPATVNNIVHNSSNEIIQRPNVRRYPGRRDERYERFIEMRERRSRQRLMTTARARGARILHLNPERLGAEQQRHFDYDDLPSLERILPSRDDKGRLERISRQEDELQRRPLLPTGLSDDKFNEFERITYDAAKEEEEEDVCPICLDPLKSGETIVILPCTHKYHEHCAKELFKNMTTCGVCRKDYNVNV